MSSNVVTHARAQSPAASPPTLDDIRRWPATVPMRDACAAIGVSKSHGYELARTGAFPARVIRAGNVYRVVTASIIELLGSQTSEPQGAA